MGVLALVASIGGYGGYTVVKGSEVDANFDTVPHTVARVIDGDTIEVEKVKVRLLGINAPERGECYFEESKRVLETLVEGKQVSLQKDITAKDRHGRLLRYVTLPNSNPAADNIFINTELVERGFAFAEAISPDTKYRDLFATAERKAKAAGEGLWGGCEVDAKTAEDLREEDSIAPSPECTIKGNISEKGYGKNYFLEGCPNYSRIKVDSRKGESYFCSERDAKKAGFTRSDSCDTVF